MSDTWHGGKGDKPRIDSYDRYSRNYDNIFKNKNELNVKYNLFLDDYRNPKDAFLYDEEKSLHQASGLSDWQWVIVRNYDQFVAYIEETGIPEVISFDNDLSDAHMNYFQKACLSPDQFYDITKVEKTGIHCAMWLRDKCVRELKTIPRYYVHSANHLARPIIREILK